VLAVKKKSIPKKSENRLRCGQLLNHAETTTGIVPLRTARIIVNINLTHLLELFPRRLRTQ
jgi:hypothetical protein